MKIRIKKQIQKDLEERYPSAAAGLGQVHPDVSPEDEHAGHVERSKHQGLCNVMEQQGALGKHVWPSADTRYKPEDRPKEKDTDIEKELYKQLHKYLGAVTKEGPPLGSESVETIKQILASGEYEDVFKQCPDSGVIMRGMQVPIEWIMKYAPQQYQAVPPTTSLLDWSEVFQVGEFQYQSGGEYGSVSSWTADNKVARNFASRWQPNMVPVILHTKCKSGLFLETDSFAIFKGGDYQYDEGAKQIPKLNPNPHEKEFLLFGDCMISGIQFRGPPKNEETNMKITTEELQRIINEELEAVIGEKKGSKRQRKKTAKKKAKRDACYHKVKRRYKVWPSAYASGALVKCRKKGAKNWGKSKKNEEVTDEEEEELSKIKDELKGASKMHKSQSDRIKKITANEGKKNCGCGQDPCKTYGIQEKKQASSEKNLGDWFDRKGEKGSKGGWVDCKAPDGDGGYKECAQGDRKKKPYCRPTPSACKTEPQKNESINEDELEEKKKKKACKPSKGKRFAKRVDGKCRSFGQKGQAKGGGDRIRPGTKKGDAYCARSAKIKKCKNPPCANALSRKKWKCRGSKSMKEEANDQS